MRFTKLDRVVAPSARSMRIRLAVVVLACLLAPRPGLASEAQEAPRHEVWLGFGGGASPEKTIFNVPDDLASQPELLIGFGYLYNIDASDAVGFHVYGGTETLPEVAVLPPGATAPVPFAFDLDTYNIGLRVRHTFTRKRLSPYFWAGVNVAQGTISNPGTNDLDYSGYSVGVGPGVLMQLGPHFSLSVEGVASFGAAKWKIEPFSNSANRDFNPGLLGVVANMGFGWGRLP
jgi:hypothetical protein